jgi:hypothetical protein
MPKLSPFELDPFDGQRQAHRDKVRWMTCCAAAMGLNLILVAVVALLGLRPPFVIIKDRLAGEVPSVRSAAVDPPIELTDARLFFINMLKLRFGWDSLSVARDLQNFLGQCYRDQRQLEAVHLHALVDDPLADAQAAGDSDDDGDEVPRVPRLQAWARAGIANTLLFSDNLEDIACVKKGHAWHCHTQATVVTQQLSPPLLSPALQQTLAFVATFLEVRHTPKTPYGLVVGALRQLPAPGAAGEDPA